jgi:hypothetical protein
MRRVEAKNTFSGNLWATCIFCVDAKRIDLPDFLEDSVQLFVGRLFAGFSAFQNPSFSTRTFMVQLPITSVLPRRYGPRPPSATHVKRMNKPLR